MDKPVENLWERCWRVVDKSARKIVWDEDEGALHCVDPDWLVGFEDRWIAELGADLYNLQLRKAEHWLAVHPRRRSARSNLVAFLNNWMIRAMKG